MVFIASFSPEDIARVRAKRGIIARIARVSHSHEPEAEERSEQGRKLAVVLGLSDPGLSEIGAFKIRMAQSRSIEKHKDVLLYIVMIMRTGLNRAVSWLW